MLTKSRLSLHRLCQNVSWSLSQCPPTINATPGIHRTLGTSSLKKMRDDMAALGYSTGYDILLNRRANKGLAFTPEERKAYRIRGLVPPNISTAQLQVQRFMTNLRHMPDDLSRYMALVALQDINEKIFYRVAVEHTQEIMPLVYTPTVGLACQKYSLILSKPRGIFISIEDKGSVYEVLCNWPVNDVRAIVVTDGERILGLGDLGCNGMGIPVGKLSLYTALAGVAPEYCLPVMLDVGTNNEKFLNDPYYVGVRQKRVRGTQYDEFIDEFMQAVVKRFGRRCLVQFEDFANHNAFRLLEKYRHQYCTFNDDIQGTASVAVAGVLSSTRITGKKLSDNTFVFYGAGEASIGIADLLVLALTREGVPVEEARKKIFLVDSKGLVVKNRPEGGLNEEKKRFAHDLPPMKNLIDAVRSIKPSFLIGAAGQGPAFGRDVLELMAAINKRPVIFALSNPTSKAECTARDAYEATKGQCVFASGSPFGKVEFDGKIFVPGQGNNSYIFPGVALAIATCAIRQVPDELFYLAAKTLSEQVTEADLSAGLVYPPIEKIREVSRKIAAATAEYAFEHELAELSPKPQNLEEYIRSQQYSVEYDDVLPPRWEGSTRKYSKI